MNRQSNVVIGQSGGPTAVINQSLVGCVEVLREAPPIGRILGARHGVRGMLEETFIDLQSLPSERLDRVAETPSAALGSCRDKPDRAYCEQIFRSLAKHQVRYFFYIGGNDSSDTCRIIQEMAQQAGEDLHCFHIPKTIDNDLQCNDHTPGYGSAARFVASAFLGDDLDNRALPGVKLNVVMGRHAGFLTAASVLGRTHPDGGPHLVYVPEIPFDEQQFVHDVDRVYSRLGRCLVAVSEGICDTAHTPMAARLAVEQGQPVERDAHGNVQLSGSGALGDFLSVHLRENLGASLRVRADTFGYMQRSFAGCVSASDRIEARMAGRHAAQAALRGETSGSITLRRAGEEPYNVDYALVPLTDVAGKTRKLDPEFVAGNNDISEAFRRYAAPLVGSLPTVELLDS